MKIRKFEAKSLRDALYLVKKEMDGQAVVLSIKEYKKKFGLAGEKSVEVTVVDNSDNVLKGNFKSMSCENLFKEEEREKQKNEVEVLKKEIAKMKAQLETYSKKNSFSPYDHSEGIKSVFEKLIHSGINPEYAFDMLKNLEEKTPHHLLRNFSLVKAQVAKQFSQEVRISQPKKGILFHCFLGGTKAGKTTALIKYAYYLSSLKKKIAILSTCSSGLKKLKSHAQTLQVPFGFISKSSDWVKAEEKLKSFEFVLVDFPSYDLKNEMERVSLDSLLPPSQITYTVNFVQSLLEPERLRDERAAQYNQRLLLENVTFTRLDQGSCYGTIFNFQRRFQTPLHSFSLGPKVLGDFELAYKEKLINLIFDSPDRAKELF